MIRTRRDWPGPPRAFAWRNPGDPGDPDMPPFTEFYENIRDCPVGAVVAVYRLEGVKRVVDVPAKRVLKPVVRRVRRRR